jgi:hypothetical protein
MFFKMYIKKNIKLPLVYTPEDELIVVQSSNYYVSSCEFKRR